MEKNQSQGKWGWIICNLPLKHGAGNDAVQWSLQPAIALSHPNGYSKGPDPNIKLLVDTEKSFQYSEELGWNWHKSWKLPAISVQLDITDIDNNETLLCPKDIFKKKVNIFAVKALVDNNNKLYLQDVGLKGSTKLELIDGKAVFQTLKFSSTSYNNEGVKFHLLVCLYLQISEDTKPKMLKAIVSPPIFVDSRKSVRDTEKFAENKLNLYIDPFFPDNFNKKFIKRETKNKESSEKDIQNSIEGLYSYLTAPNIRHKVKHPIFLSIRFSKCISLYYSQTDLSEQDRNNYVEVLQNLLFDDMDRVLNSKDIKSDDSVFLMYINKDSLEDKAKKKKIPELLSPVKCRSLAVVYSKTEIPQNFIQFTDLKTMEELYSKSYSRLIARAKNYSKEDDNEDEEPPEKTAPPERQIINLAQDSAPANNTSDWSKYFETSTNEEEPKKKVKPDNVAQPINMMDARTISFKENASKQKSTPEDPTKNPSLQDPNTLMNMHGINNSSLILGLLQQKNSQDQFSRNIAQQVNMLNAANPLAQTPSSLASLMQNQSPRIQNPNMDPLLSMVYQNKLLSPMNNNGKMPGSLPGNNSSTPQTSNMPPNFPNLGNIQQLLMMDKKMPNQPGGFSLNPSLMGSGLPTPQNFNASNFIKMGNDGAGNSQQNAALQLLQMAGLTKNGKDFNVKHEDELKDHEKK